jgi:glucose-1-phosphatase
MRDIGVVLFDVGGVLVQLSGVATMLTWLGGKVTSDEFWRMWLQSAAVREFETGRIEASEFALRVTSEFGLAIESKEFLESFAGWPTGLYPGTLEMLARVPPCYRRAILSNSNALHWPRMLNDMHLGSAIETHFVSHLSGRIKPDAEAFEHVLDSLGCKPQEVLFLDDNLINIDAARNLGLLAVRVQGATEAQQALIQLGVIRDA